MFKLFKNRGQTILEYSILLTVIVGVLITMTPWIRRSVQAVIRIVADQVGFQENAEQDTTGAYLVNMYMISRVNQNKSLRERLGDVEYIYHNETATADTQMLANLGFRPE